MNKQDTKQRIPDPEPVPKECNQDDLNPTQMVINKERDKYCLQLYESKGLTSQQEVKYAGETLIYNDMKCLFNRTEENYQRYRNLEITIGTEMLSTTEAVKGNVDKLKKWNSDLNALLKKLSKTVKDAKNKFRELNEIGCKVKASRVDKCNAAQWKALTGRENEKCDSPGKPHPKCENTCQVIEDLICLPSGLRADIDSINQATSDVVGIQVFSNIDTLEPLHKDLDGYAKEFEKHIVEVMKAREGDLKKLQDELVKSVKDITKSAIDRNSLRSEFEGYYDSLSYLCCTPCPCVGPKDPPWDPDCDDNYKQREKEDCPDKCPPRLKECEQIICDICVDVKRAFCCKPDDEDVPTPRGCCDD